MLFTYRNVAFQTIYGKGVTGDGDEMVAETTTVEVSETYTISRIKADGDSEPVCKLRTQLLYQTHLVVFLQPHPQAQAPPKKLGKGPGHTCKNSHMCCVSSLSLE